MRSICLILLLVSLVSSCAMPPPATPQTRIGTHYDKFSKLTPKQKEQVRRGEIASGMSKDAVFLAWGDASRVYQGDKDGKSRERWDYLSTKAVPSPYGPYARPYGRPYGYRGRYCDYRDPFYGNDTTYVTTRVASVWFVEGKVDSWERVR